MLRQLIFTTLFALTSSPAFAICTGVSFLERVSDAERDQIKNAVTETPFASGLLWQATRDNSTLNIVGTMHIFDPRLSGIFADVAPALATADLLLVEATEQEETALQNAIASTPNLAFITDGPTLPEQMDEDSWQALSAAASARSIPPFMAAKMQPWFLSISLPWRTLIDFMAQGTAEEQLEMLQLSLLAPELQSEMFVTMLDSYFDQEVTILWEASRIAVNYVDGLDPQRGQELFTETEQLLLIDRNRNWMPIITEATAAHDNVMLAVGAAHLPGTYGVLNLLQDDGWDIRPLPAQ